MTKTIVVKLGHFMPVLVMRRAFDAHVSFIPGPEGAIAYSCTIPLPNDGEEVVRAFVESHQSGELAMVFTTTKKVDMALLENAVRRELVMLLDAWDYMSELESEN